MNGNKKENKLNNEKDISTKEIRKDNIEEREDKSKFYKIYIGFETRVCLYIIFILVFFLSGCYIALSAFNFGINEVVNYKEVSHASYKVCLKDNNYYSKECLDEGLQYLSTLTKNINVNFDYNAKLSSIVDLILYLDEETETRKIASVNVPLAVTSYGINKEEIEKESDVSIDNNVWTDSNSYYIMIGTLLILVSLFLLIRVTRLVIKGTAKKSKYQKELSNILREYDRFIVIARDGFIPASEKRVVKVDSFKEIMDAREALNKPIIYSRVNDIKSEFIVEDIEIVYKFTIKESDFD